MSVLDLARNYRDKKLFVSEVALLENIEVNPAEKSFMRDVFFELGLAYRMLGMSQKAIESWLASNEFDDDVENIFRKLANAIFTANYLENFSATNFQKLYDLYKQTLPKFTVTPPARIYNHKKIRVGYLSADFCDHIVMSFAWTLLAELDRNYFEVYCYSAGKNFDGVTGIVKQIVDVWRDISKSSDEDAAKLIRADEIDILVDLAGHSANNRLRIMAYRPARIQVSGIGYMNSTGLNCVDYFISDKFCAGDWNKYFTEKIISLPHSHLCFTPYKTMPAPANAPCLVNGYITFGCFNNFSKVTDSMLIAWQKILSAVPNSKLILKSQVFATAECKNFIADRFSKFNFDIARLELRGHSSNYLSEYNEIDIALDTYPYTGGGTTCETLYMGVPVISMYGDRHGTRFGYSLLKNIGVGALTATNFDEYIKLAIGLANNFKLIDVLHKNLRGMMKNSPVMNQREYIRDVENVFIQIYKQG